MRSAAACLVTIITIAGTPRAHAVPVYGYEILHTYPHDPTAFTEGLFYLNGFLYESTGLEHHSSIRKVRLQTGEVLEKIEMPPGVAVSGLESNGSDQFFCGGARSGKVRAIRRPKRR